MKADLKYLLGTFSRRDRALLVLYVVAQFFVSLMDLVGLAMVLPIMSVLVSDSTTDGYLTKVSEFLGNPTPSRLVLFLAIAMVLIFTLKTVLSLMLQWWSSGLIIRLQLATSSRLLSSYMHENYLVHRRRDLSEVLRTIDAAVSDAHGKVLGGLLTLATAVLSICLIMAFMFAVMPGPTAAALVYFAVVVFALQRLLAAKNQRAGFEAVMTAWNKSHALMNAMNGFREVTMHDAQNHFLTLFDRANYRNGIAGRRANFFAAIPKYVLELTTITGIALLLVVVSAIYDSAAIMPVLALFVAATVKLLPTMSGLTSTLGVVRAGSTGLQLSVEALQQVPVASSAATAAAIEPPAQQISPITIDQVSFRYPDGQHNVLTDIALQIAPGSSLALCGSSGSGKTTLVDIILGLIPPSSGQVTYGDQATIDLGRQWHQTVAYVPQDVFLLNDTLAANVAFGEDADTFDPERISQALRRAQLDDLLADLPEGIDSMLGERGSRLSGGQRQRIGIARALYRNPKVLVLDEATSALDNETEDRISRTISALTGEMTTIIVAHRLSTVRHVDQLAFLEDGRLAALGTFEQVRERSATFNRMVELGDLSGYLER